jgi:hypothetical protein
MTFFYQRKRSRRVREAGISVVEALIGVGISASAATLFFGFLGDKEKSVRALDLRYELTEIRSSLRSHIDCGETLKSFLPKPVTTCTGAIVVKAKNKTDLVAATGTDFGSWRITPQCERVKGGLGLTFIATRPDSSGGFKTDPITGTKLDRRSPLARLFPDEARLCGEYFSTKDPERQCKPGQYVTQIRSDGSVVCESADKVCLILGGNWTGGQCTGKTIPGKCSGREVMAGIDGSGKPICVSGESRLNFYNVKKVASGASKVTVCCNSGDRMYACSGGREKNVNDTCNEEVCGFIGAVINGNCCTAGVDTDKGTESVADGMCLQSL